MEEGLRGANFIDPRLQEVEDTTTRLYNSALKELGYSIPLHVALYNQIRYYEDYGKLKIGYSVASKETLAKQFGVTVKQIEKAYDNLTNKYHLGSWVVCEEKVFRNVKKVWVSNVRQARGTMEDAARMLENSSSVGAELLQRRSNTPPAEELPSEVRPLSESNPKVLNYKNRTISGTDGGDGDARSISTPSATFKPSALYAPIVSIFKKAGYTIGSKKRAMEKLEQLIESFADYEDEVTIAQIKDAAAAYIQSDWNNKNVTNFLSPSVFVCFYGQKGDKPKEERWNPWAE